MLTWVVVDSELSAATAAVFLAMMTARSSIDDVR
jgi:hypothetical protein